MNKKTFLAILSLVVIANLVLSTLTYFNQKNISFFDYNEVYNDSKLKKELEGDLQKVVSNRKDQLDSLQLELSFLSQTIESGTGTPDRLNKFEDMKERFLTLQNRYEEENIRKKPISPRFAQI